MFRRLHIQVRIYNMRGSWQDLQHKTHLNQVTQLPGGAPIKTMARISKIIRSNCQKR